MSAHNIWFKSSTIPYDLSFLQATNIPEMKTLFRFGHLFDVWDDYHKIGYVWEHTPFQAYLDGVWKSSRSAYHFWIYCLPEYQHLKKDIIQAYLDLHQNGLFHLHTLPQYNDASIYKQEFQFHRLHSNVNHLIFWKDTQE